jgi:predicted RNA binding protein YcfA (HicA-like mRNA interferase family)
VACRWSWSPARAGSHGRLYVGDRFTTIKDRKKEIGPGLLAKMLRDLGIDPNDL